MKQKVRTTTLNARSFKYLQHLTKKMLHNQPCIWGSILLWAQFLGLN